MTLSIQTEAPVAIKVIHTSSLKNKMQANLSSEIQILTKVSFLKHPNIVNLVANESVSPHVFLVFDWCAWGDLGVFLRSRVARRGGISATPLALRNALDSLATGPFVLPVGGPFGGLLPLFAGYLLGQLAEALNFLFGLSVLHRDLKPQNMLLCPPPHAQGRRFVVDSTNEYLDHCLNNPAAFWALPLLPILKLADFGFARYMPTTSMAETLCGSPLYMAPEILRYEKYDARADLWSVGVVLFELFFGRVPFSAENHIALLRKISKARNLVIPECKIAVLSPDADNYLPSVLSSIEKDLLRQLLQQDPQKRLTMKLFFEHPLIIGSRELAAKVVRFRLTGKDIVSSFHSESLGSPDECKYFSAHAPLDSDYVFVSKDCIEVNDVADNVSLLFPQLRRATYSLPVDGSVISPDYPSINSYSTSSDGSTRLRRFLSMFKGSSRAENDLPPLSHYRSMPSFTLPTEVNPIVAGLVMVVEGYARKAWAVLVYVDSIDKNDDEYVRASNIVLGLLYKAICLVKGHLERGERTDFRHLTNAVEYVRQLYNSTIEKIEHRRDQSVNLSGLRLLEYAISSAERAFLDDAERLDAQTSLYMLEALLCCEEVHLSEEEDNKVNIIVARLRNKLVK